MKKVVMTCLSASVLLFACKKNHDDDHHNDGVSKSDQTFVLSASEANTAEIQAGQLASSMAENGGIRDFGQMMVDDHSSSKSELMDIANDLNIATSDSLDTEHQALKAQLMTLSGRAFDSVYIHAQVKDHQKAIVLFTSESENGQNWKLKDYATRTLPHLQMHLQKADSLAALY